MVLSAANTFTEAFIMGEVTRNIYLLSITPNAGELLEKIAGISYQTQRFDQKVQPKLIKFASGRCVP